MKYGWPPQYPHMMYPPYPPPSNLKEVKEFYKTMKKIIKEAEEEKKKASPEKKDEKKSKVSVPTMVFVLTLFSPLLIGGYALLVVGSIRLAKWAITML